MNVNSIPADALLQRIAERVRAQRLALGWTMAHAAHMAGLSPRFYAQVEAGQANIAIGRLQNLAAALQMELVALLRSNPLGAEGTQASSANLGIALLGIRGSGKSTLGTALGATLHLPFLELDDAIATLAGLQLPEIFAIHGENYYRQLGGKAIDQLIAADQPTVVALPGGIVLEERIFAQVEAHFTTVWLRTEPEDCMNRVLAQGDYRPMSGHRDAMAALRKLLATRKPYYQRAALTLDTSQYDLAFTHQRLLQKIKKMRPEV